MGAWGRIRVLDGPIAGTVFFLDRPVLQLGRAAESDLRVPDATVSRNQAELRCGHEGVILVGLSDKNPLWVNGEPLEGPRMLRPGDRFQAGLVHMEFEAVQPTMTTATAGGPSGADAAPVTMLHGGPVHPSSTGRTDLRCPRCGAKELPGARYCGSCGAALPSAVIATMQTMIPASMQPQAPAPPSPAPPPAPPPPAPPPHQAAPAAPAPERPPETGDPQEPSPGRSPKSTPTNPKPITGATPRPKTQTMQRPADTMPGEAAPGLILLGRYELRRVLGAGRATEVFSAFDRQKNVEVAVKVLRPEAAASPQVRDQFFHSSNAFVVARHPNLLRVEEVHEEGDLCFAVMELLPGLRLREQIRARPATAGGYPATEARLVGAALCGALQSLHTVGVHGNVRPENIWITPQGIPKLLDPGLLPPPGGLAAWTGGGDLEAAFYSSPEVLQGKAPDALSDQYSVGAVLYHMLAGEPAAGRVEPMKGMRKDIPDALSRAVDRSISSHPPSRFPSMAEFAGALGAPGSGAPARRFLIAGIAAAALLLVGSSVFWFPPAKGAWKEARRDLVAEARAEAAALAAAAAEQDARAEGEFSDPVGLAQGSVEREKGDFARTESRCDDAVVAYAEAKRLFEREGAAARGRREDRRRGDAAAADWQTAQKEMESVAGPVMDLKRRAADAAPGPAAGSEGVVEARSRKEREAAAVRLTRLAADLVGLWENEFDRGAGRKKAFGAAGSAESLAKEGRHGEAEAPWREAAAHLHRAVAEARHAVVQRALDEAGAPTLPGLDAAREKATVGAQASGGGDRPAAAARWREASEAFAALLVPSFDLAGEKFLRDQAALRCATCAAAPGACTACSGAKSIAADCGKCGASGKVPAECAKCRGGKTEVCAKCNGGKTAKAACKSCGGSGKKICAACQGEASACPTCKGEGSAKCLRCKGTGKPTAMGEKAKCPDCDGTGAKPCSECKGAKSRACTSCGGNPESPCADCGGKGEATVPCPDCGGAGTKGCSACAGTGSVTAPCGACENGKVSAPCPKCAGSGTCDACGGRGRKE